MFQMDATVIGGGIVGCAIADELARRGYSCVLLEQESGLARSTTSRNSEVSHGGMYYPAGTLKARFCVEGRRLLKEFCAAAGVGYRECGKLIVAVTDREVGHLEDLHALGAANGVEDLRLLEAGEVPGLEPEITAVGALFSPRTGILDAEGAARAFARRAEAAGARIMVGARVTGLRRKAGVWEVDVSPGDGGMREGWRHGSRCVVNAAGLWADQVAALAGIDVEGRGWGLHLSKGNYFALDPRHQGRIRHLVYPVPPADGTTLGVHVCLDLGGRLKLGPDFEVLPGDPRSGVVGSGLSANLDYRVDPVRRRAFFEGARTFLPWLEAGDLTPDMCGIRPKLCATGFRDYVVAAEEGDREGLVNLVGIDSPGLTSAPALALEVGRLAAEIL